jgi:hypothetical protein
LHLKWPLTGRVSSCAMTPFPACIVSGGQTGADRAGLDFAIANSLTHAGYCPRGRLAEDGAIPLRYNLTETTSAEYAVRTRRNVALGDATVIFARVPAQELMRQRRSGSGLTAREAERTGRAFLVLSHFPDVAADAAELRAFFEKHGPRILNVAGSRESAQPGIHAHVFAVLATVAGMMPWPVKPAVYPKDVFSDEEIAELTQAGAKPGSFAKYAKK